MKRFLLALALIPVLALTACTDPDLASQKALGAMGMTNVRVEYTFLGHLNCSDSDSWSRTFTATGANGQPVTGTVCGGYVGKGATVRFD